MVARIFLLVLCVTSAIGLFEDQIGLFDWRQQYIGDVKFLLTDYKAKYLLVGSTNNVVAAVNNKDGSLVWRQVMENGGELVDLQLCDEHLVSLSLKNASIIRAWNPLTGSILWEKSLSDKYGANAAFRCLGHNSLIAFSDAGVILMHVSNGKVLWTDSRPLYKKLPDTLHIELLGYTEERAEAVVLGCNPSELSGVTSSRSTCELTTVSIRVPLHEPQSSTLSTVEALRTDWLEKLQSCIIVRRNTKTAAADASRDPGWHVVCVSSSDSGGVGGVLRTKAIEHSGFTEWKSTKIPQSSPRVLKLDDSRFLVTSSSGLATVYVLSAEGLPEERYSLNKAMICAKSSLNGKDYLFTAFQETNQPWKNFALSIYYLDSGEPVPELTPTPWTIAAHHGSVEWIRPTVYIDSAGTLTFRLLVRTEDHAIQHIRHNGHQRWLREEALASIVAVEMVDLPVSEYQARMEDEFGHANSNIFEMFAKRFQTQAAQLLAFLKYCLSILPHLLRTGSLSPAVSISSADSPVARSANPGGSAQSTTDNGGDSAPMLTTYTIPPRLRFPWTGAQNDSEDGIREDWNELEQFLTRDNFNLHKMMVVATSLGKVFGLESERGRLVWEHLVPSATVLANGKLALFQQRNTAHFPLPPIATLLLRSKETNLPMLYSFNPITGVPLHKTAGHVHHLQSDILQAVLQPGPASEASDYIRPILLLDTKLKLHVYPTEYADLVASPDGAPIYIYTVEHAEARLAGYKVGPRLTTEQNNETVYEAVRVWQMQLQSARIDNSEDTKPHVIVQAAARPVAEHIHSVGRVLGDRSVLYKYLNPNLIAVVTAGGDALTQTNSVAVYLIDVVAGRILYSATHRRCSEPISLVHSENWIVYTYYNHKSLRHEVTVLELYEPFNRSGGSGELCAAYLVPGPWQLFLQNVFPTWWFSSSSAAADVSLSESADLKPWNRGSRSYFSSLFRATDSSGICRSTGTNSLVPQVMQQSYILSTPPTHGAAAASLTERGITSKSVIFGLQKGALIELPKSFLDPRRTLDMTPELMEEAVHPYAPVLPLSDQAVISYNQTVLGIRSIRTAMTGLESTSLVFAYGLDLFFTRIAPSLTYDLLKEDFDYTAIATVTLGMIVASVVTQRLAARRAVLRAWS